MRDLTSAEDEKRNVEVLGELDVKISFDVHFDGKGWQLSNGSNCVYLSKASVAIHWRNSINLASEMIPDTCADKSVRRSLTEVIGEQHGYQPGVEQKVKDALREASHNTIIDASLENARQRLLDSFGKMVNAVVKPEADRYFQKLKGLEKVGLLDKIATQCDDRATQKLLEAAAKP